MGNQTFENVQSKTTLEKGSPSKLQLLLFNGEPNTYNLTKQYITIRTVTLQDIQVRQTSEIGRGRKISI